MDEKQFVLEAWKQTVAVQMHFNDIAVKLRTLALTVVAAILTAQSLSAGKAGPLATFAALLAWGAFYVIDRWWYHALLIGAVEHGLALESRARDLGLQLQDGASVIGLTGSIGKQRPEGLNLQRRNLIDWFYGLVALALLVVLIIRFMTNG